MDIRCCCTPENLIGTLPAGLNYPRKELDDGTWAYLADRVPADVLDAGKKNRPKKRPRKTWREK